MAVTCRTRERERAFVVRFYHKMKRFKYDVVKLIESVRDRPCLWNKHIENYKDRVERKLAWIEIFNILDERYDTMSSDDKRLTSEMVLSKWTNVRDTFVKSLRNKAGKTKKQYVLYEHLKFLLEIIPEAEQQEQDNLGYITDELPPFKDDTQVKESTSFNQPLEYEISYEESNESSEADVPVLKESSSKRKRSKKENPKEEDQSIDFVSIDDPRIMNEDEAFFASLLPTIVKYDEDERLEFRIEVLALMKRIKDKRKWSSEVIGQS